MDGPVHMDTLIPDGDDLGGGGGGAGGRSHTFPHLLHPSPCCPPKFSFWYKVTPWPWPWWSGEELFTAPSEK